MKKIIILLALSLSLFATNKVEVGSSLDLLTSFEYETPEGRNIKIPAKTELIIITFQKRTSRLVNKYLEKQEKYFLPNHNIVYITDLSKMPRFLMNMFALPKMQEYKHQMYTQFADEFRKITPNKSKHITLLKVENGLITNIELSKSIDFIKEAIEVK